MSHSTTLTASCANASVEVLMVLMKALLKSQCTLTAYNMNGTYRYASLEITVEGLQTSVDLFKAVIDGWKTN